MTPHGRDRSEKYKNKIGKTDMENLRFWEQPFALFLELLNVYLRGRGVGF